MNSSIPDHELDSGRRRPGSGPSIRAVLGRGLLLALLVTGCSGPAREAAPPAGEPAGTGPELRVLHSFRFPGSEEDGFVTTLLWWKDQLLVGTRKGLKFLGYRAGGAGGAEESGAAEAGFTDRTEPMKPVLDGHSTLDYPVTALTEFPDTVGIGTEDGFATFDGRNFLSESIGRLTALSFYEGTIWVGRNSGLERKIGKDWHAHPTASGFIKLNQNSARHVRAVAVSAQGQLWIGSEFGVYVYDKAAPEKWVRHLYGDFQNIVHSAIFDEPGNCPLAGNVINDIRLDPFSQRLLIATETGLSIHDGQESWVTIKGDHEVLTSDKGEGLHRVLRKGNIAIGSPVVRTAVAVGKWIFLATGEGLARVDETLHKQDPKKALTLLTTEHGLPADAVTWLAPAPALKILFVGTEKGVAAVGPIPFPE